MHGSDDEALLRAWRSGDTRAGSALLRRHTTTVYRFLLSKTDPVVAEELTQATFEACIRKIDRVDGSRVRAYLLGIAYKLLLQHRTRWVRRDARHEEIDRSIAAECTSPSGALFREQRLRMILHALQKLPLELQSVVELYYWEELSIAEVSQVLEIPGGTVKSRLAHARELLRPRIVESVIPPLTSRS
jgi:RNA polymerase sigma factor (sigma-70 family)